MIMSNLVFFHLICIHWNFDEFTVLVNDRGQKCWRTPFSIWSIQIKHLSIYLEMVFGTLSPNTKRGKKMSHNSISQNFVVCRITKTKVVDFNFVWNFSTEIMSRTLLKFLDWTLICCASMRIECRELHKIDRLFFQNNEFWLTKNESKERNL